MPDIFRATKERRKQEAGLSDVNADKKKMPKGDMTQSQFSKAGKEDQRKKNLEQRDKLLKKRGYK